MPNLNTTTSELRWEYRGKDKGFFCPVCGSGCLLNYESDFFPSDYCPHCGQKLEKPLEGWTSNRTDYVPSTHSGGWNYD